MTLPSAHRSAQSLQLEALEAREVPAAPFEQLPVLPDWDPEVIANARRIAERGAALGRNPQAFIKFGDSNTRDPGYLTQLGDPGYNPVVTGLATQHPELVDVWLKYRAPLAVGGNSYTQDSAASIYGGNLAQVLPRLPLEIALRNPSVALVMIGSNDQVIYSPETYRSLLETTLDQMAAAGVVPVLSTIPDIPAYMGRGPQIRAYNQVIAEVAEEKDVLLVNYFWVQAGLPFLALNYSEPFPVHLTTSPRGGGWFHPFDLVFGQNSRNLVTLQALDWLEEKVFSAPAAPALPDSPAWVPPEPGRSLLAVGSDRGGAPVVRMFDPETGELRWWFQAYSDAVQSGVRVAVGDVTGDGVRDVVTVPASGAAAHVRIFSGVDGSDAGGFFAFEPEFNGGASVAVGDLDQDGKGEIVVGAGAGGAPRVRVFRGGDFAPIRDFFAYESAARGGVNVAVGDLGGELGQAIVTGPGEGGGPLVKVFHLHGEEPLRAFFAGDPATTQGAGVAAGDLDGDGGDELVVGSGTGPEVRIIDPRLAAERAAFRAGDRESHRGARIAVVPRVGDRGGLIALGSGPGELPAIRLFVPSGAVQRVLDPGADAVIRPGVFVAG